MIKVGYIKNAERYSGVGNRAYAVERRLRDSADVRIVDFMLDGGRGVLHKHGRPIGWVSPWMGPFGAKSVNWLRLGKRLRRYLAHYDKKPFELFHLTNQTMAFLAGRFTAPTVVTVHDIIEILDPQDQQAAWLNRYLYSGIPRADHIIAVSEYTKQTLMKHYRIASDAISVIGNGVDDAVFYPIADFANTLGYQELRRELKLGDAHPIVLYVGSDHPRKNLPVALEAFAALRKERPDAVFVKVGEPGLPAGREQTLATADRLGIRQAMRFVGKVGDDRLNELYNLADVFIFPSRLEGFGLPPLQAMAAGLPVLSSNATSLPEVVGDPTSAKGLRGASAALMYDPDDVDGFTEGLTLVTSDRQMAQEMRAAGLARAAEFSWDAATEAILGVYKNILQ